MTSPKGQRKYRAFMYTITGSFILSALAIVTVPESASVLIASITGMSTSTMIPFIYGNKQEHKLEA